MADEQDEADVLDEEAKPGGGMGLYLMIVLVILLLEGAGGYVILDRALPAPERAAKEDTEELTRPKEAKVFHFYEGIHQMVVNPVTAKGKVLIQVSLAIELSRPAAAEEMALKHEIIWDMVLRRLETYPVATLRDPYKQDIKSSLKREINAELRNGDAIEIYFTDIIIQ